MLNYKKSKEIFSISYKIVFKKLVIYFNNNHDIIYY